MKITHHKAFEIVWANFYFLLKPHLFVCLCDINSSSYSKEMMLCIYIVGVYISPFPHCECFNLLADFVKL